MAKTLLKLAELKKRASEYTPADRTKKGMSFDETPYDIY